MLETSSLFGQASSELKPTILKSAQEMIWYQLSFNNFTSYKFQYIPKKITPCLLAFCVLSYILSRCTYKLQLWEEKKLRSNFENMA